MKLSDLDPSKVQLLESPKVGPTPADLADQAIIDNDPYYQQLPTLKLSELNPESVESSDGSGIPEGGQSFMDPMAVLEGYGQGLSLNYLPHLQAKAEPVTDRIFNLFNENEVEPAPMSQLTSNDENYLESRDRNIARINEFAKNSPGSYYGGMGAGLFNLGLITGGAGPAIKGVQGGAKVITPVKNLLALKKAARLKKLADATKVGMTFGAVMNPGDIEGVIDELQVTPRLKNAFIGALTGFGLQQTINKIAQHSLPLAERFILLLRNRQAKRALEKQLKLNQLGPQKITGTSKPTSGKDVLTTIKEFGDDVRPTEQTIKTNKQYGDLGLDELTPTQMQPKIVGEPTPAQYAESLLKTRDAKLYNQQLGQHQSLEKVTDKFRDLGAPNRETFGAGTNLKLDTALKEQGKIIGDFKKNIASVRTRTAEMPKPPKVMEKITIKDPISGSSEKLSVRLSKVKNFKQLDDLSSDLGSEISRRFTANGNQSDRGIRELTIFKTKIEKYTENFFPDGKPRAAYQQYAKIKRIYNDTLKGALKTGGDDKVLTNVTKTAENFRQFKDVAKSLKRPDLVTDVQENYLSNMFNQKNWRSAWDKARKTQAYREIVPKHVHDKIKLLAKYSDQMRSTFTSSTNPPKSGVINAMVETAKNPSKIIEMVIGDERKFAKALKRYHKIINQPPQAPKTYLGDEYLKRVAGGLKKIDGVTKMIKDNSPAYSALLFYMASRSKSKNLKQATTEIKGRDKWLVKGLNNVTKINSKIDWNDPEVIKKMFFDKKGKSLLQEASSGNSRKMAGIVERIDKHLAKGKK